MDKSASRCFPPVAGPRTKLLILGSLPGVRSLEVRQYYGHPRNHFWPLMGALTATADLPEWSYEQRLAHLQAHGIGLWDVVAQAVRPGSLDQHIRSVQPNGLADFLLTLPALRAIAFNGAAASRIGRKQLSNSLYFGPVSDASPALPRGGDKNNASITLASLPSTSPANTMALTRKMAAWLTLGQYLGE